MSDAAEAQRFAERHGIGDVIFQDLDDGLEEDLADSLLDLGLTGGPDDK